MPLDFPPQIQIGSRVWTTRGYSDHGPLEGPKIDIAGNMAGTISSAETPYGEFGSRLYTVNWDNGQVSKHYATGLFCIGRFDKLSEFIGAIRVLGPVELTVGPQGGFRHTKLRLEYDGAAEDIEVSDRNLWFGHIEDIAKKAGVEITTVKLPPKRRKKGGKQ